MITVKNLIDTNQIQITTKLYEKFVFILNKVNQFLYDEPKPKVKVDNPKPFKYIITLDYNPNQIDKVNQFIKELKKGG